MDKEVVMKVTVFKYPVPLNGPMMEISMPVGAEVLCLQLQDGHPMIWARVYPNEPTEVRRFQWIGTGHPADGLNRYVGTIVSPGGELVFHLFEVE